LVIYKFDIEDWVESDLLEFSSEKMEEMFYEVGV